MDNKEFWKVVAKQFPEFDIEKALARKPQLQTTTTFQMKNLPALFTSLSVTQSTSNKK